MISAEIPPASPKKPLQLLSVIIPARDEEGCIASTIEHLHLELRLQNIPHEIASVEDGSRDSTWTLLTEPKAKLPKLPPVPNAEAHGIGRAVICCLAHARGDACAIMLADESDAYRDVVRYWTKLNESYDRVLESRFIPSGGVIDYPRYKLSRNRLVNFFIRTLFRIASTTPRTRSKPAGKRRSAGAVPSSPLISTSPSSCPSRQSSAAFSGPLSQSSGATAAPVRPSSRSRKWASATSLPASLFSSNNGSAGKTTENERKLH